MTSTQRVQVIERHLRAPKKPEPFREWVTDHYVSPYTLEKCPLDAVVLYNPSLHANNVAVEDLLNVWPSLPIIQTLQEGRRLCVGVTSHVAIPKGKWGDMECFARCWNDYVLSNAWLRGKKVGFYPMWSPMAEDSAIARAVLKMGLHWIGAVPDAMDGLGKTEYKRFCQQNGLPTADFFELSVPDCPDLDEACKRMTARYFELVKGSPLDGKAFFVKSDYGGGGRGTKKAQPNLESITTAIRKVVSETGKTDLIYAELALDLSGACLYQIEMEADAGNLVDGGRLVYFNARNQKMVELGFSSEEIIKYLPEKVYQECIRCSDIITRLSKYDGRGTNEILIVKLPSGEWKIFNSEFNKRIQVEHKALSYLKRYQDGHLFNTVADQLMRSCGYPPPDYKVDLLPSGFNAIGHVRLIAPEITVEGEISFPVGVTVDSLILPKGQSATVDIGPLFSDTDAQFGCVLVNGLDWRTLVSSLQTFASDTFVFGQNVRRDYLVFLQKFFRDKRVHNLSLSCNKTFDVLKSETPVESTVVTVSNYLVNSISNVIVNSWRPEAGVPNRPYPTLSQFQEYEALQGTISVMPIVRNTPFTAYVGHLNEERYFRDLKAQISALGGGMVCLFPRDVQQESGGSESQLITATTRQLLERIGADCGYFGFETGGAQYQTAEMAQISSMLVIEKSICCNMATHSLTRSHWMNALELLSPDEIRYVLRVTANIVRSTLNVPANSKLVPYFPYNFHAGNTSEMDTVTDLMLEAGMSPIPSFCWDPRFTGAHMQQWLNRQYVLWKKHNRTLHAIRIKNAGQTKEWTADAVFGAVCLIRESYKRVYGPNAEPIVHIHNHNFNGLASHVVLKALNMCQQAGYNLLLVDTAPVGMTHNDNVIIAKGLRLNPEQIEKLLFFNETCHTCWNITVRFHDFKLINTDPYTIWAGGTGSSDQIAARKIDLKTNDVEPAKVLGAQVTGLGAIVTPFSQWSMVTGFTCYKQGLRTFEAVLAHINKGGTLNLPKNILVGLYEWPTLLEKPEHVKRLLKNHLKQDPTVFKEPSKQWVPLNIAAIKKQILAVAPQRNVSEVDIARVISYRDFAIKTIQAESLSQDMNWAIYNPHLAFAEKVPIGTKFLVLGLPIVYSGYEEVAGTPDVILTFNFKGQWIRVRQKDAAKLSALKDNTAAAKPTADPKNPNHVGAFMPGMIEAVYVKAGQTVKNGDLLYAVNSMKMVTNFKAGPQHDGKTVQEIFVKKGDELSFSAGAPAPLVILLK